MAGILHFGFVKQGFGLRRIAPHGLYPEQVGIEFLAQNLGYILCVTIELVVLHDIAGSRRCIQIRIIGTRPREISHEETGILADGLDTCRLLFLALFVLVETVAIHICTCDCYDNDRQQHT